MSSQSFSEIWYRPDEKNLFDLLAYKDMGRLTIDHCRIIYSGRKERLTITRILKLDYCKIGRDFINNWVKIDYEAEGDRRSAYFADGGWMGWRGILGGTAAFSMRSSR